MDRLRKLWRWYWRLKTLRSIQTNPSRWAILIPPAAITLIEACIRDDDEGSDCDQLQVTVVINQPPVADAGGPYSGNEGTTINLSASKSTDPNNKIVRYEWDLDNDGQFDDAMGKKPKFKAIDNGVFTVRVRVTDAGGLSSCGRCPSHR